MAKKERMPYEKKMDAPEGEEEKGKCRTLQTLIKHDFHDQN
jgi:hypothetical protein